MIAVAVVVAVAIVPAAASGAPRQVLRSAAGPAIDLSREVSPLTSYRSLFADDRAGQVLFTVTPTDGGTLPDRIRLATLDSYDGAVFRAGGAGAVDAGRFVRVPATLDPGAGPAMAAEVDIESLTGVWMPTAGRLADVTFADGPVAQLYDGFYYDADASAGVETAGGGLAEGDSYTLRGVQLPDTSVDGAAAPGGDPSSVEPPESLRTWVQEHVSGSGGSALIGLVALLRQRGYLSHALSEPAGTTPVWAEGLAGYVFQPSASGHSLARIDQMFQRLLEREADPRAATTGNYVAAIGDDEQFAVATALIANQLGFPARVVVGARLTSTDPTLPVCEQGSCRADDMAAWTEVRTADGQWLAIDVTPQYAQSPSLDVTRQRDPENATDVQPDTAQEAVPPQPQQDDDQNDTPQDTGGLDLGWLFAGLHAGGIGLAALGILAGPFLVIAAAKLLRRRARRSAAEPATRVAGGWDEYVDAAVDAGAAVTPAATRAELAAAFATPGGGGLAVAADRAVFGRAETDDDEAAEFWRIVDAERRSVTTGLSPWRRLLAAVSLRSFLRALRRGGAIAAITPRRARVRGTSSTTVERGRRGPGGVRRTTS